MMSRVILLSASLLLLSGAGATAAERPLLEPGRPLELTVSSGAPLEIEVDVSEGSLALLEAEQREANVAVEILEKGELADRVAAVAVPGSERLEWIHQQGSLVRLSPAEGAKGLVVLTLSVSSPSGEDALRIEGGRLIRQADRVLGMQTAESKAQALSLYERGITILRRLDDLRALGEALDSWAWALSLDGQKPRALPIALEALQLRRTAGDSSGELQTLQMIGLLHLWLGDWENALATNGEVLELARRQKDRQNEANALHNRGGIHWSIDEMETALENYGKALRIHEELGSRRPMSSSLNNIGDAYRRLGEYDRAREYFRRALSIRRELGDRAGEGHSLHTLALAELEDGHVEAARTLFEQALAIRKQVGDPRGIAYSTGGLGSALFELKQFEPALALSQEALAMWRELGERRGEVETLHQLGVILNAMERRDEALAHLEQSLAMSQRLRDHTTEAETWLAIATARRDGRQYAAARSAVEEAIGVIDRLRAGIGSSDLRSTYFARVRKYYDFYVDLLMRMEQSEPDAGWAWKALEITERARARTFLETLSAAKVDIRTGVDHRLLDEEADLVRRIRLGEKTRAVYLEAADQEKLAALEQELSRLAREHDLLIGRIRRTSAAYASLVMPEPIAAARMQELLGRDSLLVAIHVGEESSYAWFVAGDRIEWRQLPERREIDHAARALHETLTARARSNSGADLEKIEADTAEQAMEIAAWLIPPTLAPELERLVFVPDAGLHYVPYGMLPAGGKPLIEHYQIVTAPSMSVVAAIRDRDDSRAPRRRIGIFADPVFRSDDPRVRQALARRGRTASPVDGESDSGSPNESVVLRSASDTGLTALPRLRFSRREAQSIAALAGGSAKPALDFDADLTRLRAPEMSEFGTVHFATHGLINSRAPELSGLVLSLVAEDGKVRNGFVSLSEIYNLDLAADLVVLSACQTALGDEVRGEGLIGLTRGFMHAGASRVVASLWQVDDRATSVLMERFYREMLENSASPPEALRRAQRSMSAEPRWASPYYWAAFQIQGDWQE